MTRWQVQLAIGVLTALVIWPLAAWDRGQEPIKTAVAGETLDRPAPGPTVTTAAPGETSTSTTATTAPVPPSTAPPTTKPPATTPPTTKPPATAPPTTATTAPPTTTTTAPKAPKAIRRQTASQVFPGLQLTLTASPPESGAARVAEFGLLAEFGDTRVLRFVHIDFGDGTGTDIEVRAWDCWDPAAPNPYQVAGPSHTYAGAGTYSVVVTVRTGVCVPDQGEPVTEETASLPLALAVL